MQLGRHARVVQGLEERDAVLGRHRAVLVGGEQEGRRVFLVTCISVERWSTDSGDGLGPSRLRREPAWVYGSFMVMTG